MQKTVLLTGCAGFIGSHLSETLLDNGFKVIGMDNFDDFYARELKEMNLVNATKHADFQFLERDITQKEAFEGLPPIDMVIHLAAKAGVGPSVKNPEAYYEVNVKGTLNVLEYIKAKGIKKMIFASSSSIYGNNGKVPFEETDEVNEPISPYAASKRACELINYTYHHLYQLDVLNLRFFTVYGERQRPDLVIHKFANLISEGKPITLYGDGTTARDYTHIKDVMLGIMGAISYLEKQQGVYEIINIGNNKPVKLMDLVNKLYVAMGETPKIERMENQSGDMLLTYASTEKANQLFAYAPKMEFDQGLIDFVKWHRENTHVQNA